MISSIESAIKSGHGNAIVYAGALGLLASDIIPTPADSAYLYLQRKLKEKQLKGEITSKQYWTYESISYYTLNPIYWALVLGAVYLTKGGYMNKIKIGGTIIASGALLAVIHKNIVEEEKTFGK
jgi:hypothetical protein